MLKILYLPIGKQPGTERAFRKFASTKVLDFMSSRNAAHDLTQITNSFKPDLVHMQLQMTSKIPPNVVAELKKQNPGTIFTNWTGDIRSKPCRNFIGMSGTVDFSLLSSTGQIELFRNHGCKNPMYWQIGYDPVLYYPKNKANFKYDVSFIANNYNNMFPDSKMRGSVVVQIKQNYQNRSGIFGSGYNPRLKIKSCTLEQTNDIYNDSICIISISNFNDVEHYFSDRMLMCLASGRPTITYRFPGLGSYFTDRGDLLVANSVQEIFQLIDKCKANLNWANEIGRNGHLKVLSEHTFES
ncbi:MAG: glycosyltransferase, partial [Candidatus Thorarchaeota archaeon]